MVSYFVGFVVMLVVVLLLFYLCLSGMFFGVGLWFSWMGGVFGVVFVGVVILMVLCLGVVMMFVLIVVG